MSAAAERTDTVTGRVSIERVQDPATAAGGHQ
jgi:hypothetical protein